MVGKTDEQKVRPVSYGVCKSQWDLLEYHRVIGEKITENQQPLVVNTLDKWVTVLTDDNFPMRGEEWEGKKASY